MDEGGCSIMEQRTRYHTQLAKLVIAGASELVDVTMCMERLSSWSRMTSSR